MSPTKGAQVLKNLINRIRYRRYRRESLKALKIFFPDYY